MGDYGGGLPKEAPSKNLGNLSIRGSYGLHVYIPLPQNVYFEILIPNRVKLKVGTFGRCSVMRVEFMSGINALMKETPSVLPSQAHPCCCIWQNYSLF